MPPDVVTGTLQALAAQAAVFLALLLAAAGLHKGLSWTRSRTAAERFAGVPRPAAGVAVIGVITAELIAAVLLVLPAARAAGALAAALLWSLYFALIVAAIRANRRDVDCGCSFGAAAGASLGAYHLVRNAAMVVAAVAVAAVCQRSGGIAASASQALGACALLALYGAVEQVSAIVPLRRGELL